MKKVQFTRVNPRGGIETLFNVGSDLDILEISDCNLGTLNYTFLSAKTLNTKIINNDFTLDHESAFIIKARNWSVVQNKIKKVKGRMEIGSHGVNSRVLIENNEVEFSKESQETDNIFHLNFEAGQRVAAVKIVNTNLGKLRRKFISDISLDTLEISDCSLTLDNEGILDLSVRRFVFVNNQVENIKSEAFRLRVGELGMIANNSFQHVQLESFARIAPASPAPPSLEIKNNWIENFEPGFLIIQQNWSKLQIENVFLNKSCDCQLNLFTTDQIKLINNEVLIGTVVQNTYCTKLKLVNFYDYSREHCPAIDSPEQITEVFWIAIREGDRWNGKLISPEFSCHFVIVSLHQKFSITNSSF